MLNASPSSVIDVAALRTRVDPRLSPIERLRLQYLEARDGSESQLFLDELTKLCRKRIDTVL